MPNVFVTILVLFLGTLVATFVADIVYGAVSSARIGSPGLYQLGHPIFALFQSVFFKNEER
jgi:hypothetical protein